MAPAVAKRTSYSFFDVPSLYSRNRVRVSSSALERLLIELETTPGVTDCQFENRELPFFIGQKERVAVLNFAVSRQGDSRPHALRVQLVQGTRSEEENWKVQTALDYCKANGLEHRVMLANRPVVGLYELQNRNAAHAWLTRAWTWPSLRLEYQLVKELGPGPLPLSELARRLGVSDLQVRVVFLRCWLRGLVHWDIATEYILRDLTIKGVGHD